MRKKTDVSTIVGQNMRVWRAILGMSQQELGVEMRTAGTGWMTQTVGYVERGERGVSVDELVALAHIFEIPPSDLLVQPRLVGA